MSETAPSSERVTVSRYPRLGRDHATLARGGSGRELALERGPEPRCHTRGTEPLGEACRFGFDGVDRLPADVLQQSVDDFTAPLLRPTPDQSAVPPHRRARVARSVEQTRTVRPDEPLPFA